MILIDYRDGSNELIPFIPDCVPCDLPSADVAIPGNGPNGEIIVGIEVKKIKDLLDSETSGRLIDTQLPKMVVEYPDFRWLLAVGEFRRGQQGELQYSTAHGWKSYHLGPRPIPWGYLTAFITELQVIGVKWYQVRDNKEAADWVMVQERFWSKEWDKHKATKKFDNSAGVGLMPEMDPVKKAMAQVAAKFPNLGWNRAMAAAYHFGSVIQMVCAPAQEWEQVPGIGKVIAKSLVRFFHGQ